MNIEIRRFPAMRVACVHHRGPYNKIGPAFQKLGMIAGQAGLFQLQDAMMVGLYHSDPRDTSPDDLESDAAIVVPPSVPLPDELTEKHVPAAEYACAMHFGPYENLPVTWKHLMEVWFPASGRNFGEGPAIERYLNDPRNTAPAELRTEICVPVSA